MLDETAEIARTQAHSASLNRELGLLDLALLQVLFIVGLQMSGYAAKQGGTHVVFWLLAIPFFYVPLAAVVIYLSRRLPLEGGAYQWAKIGLSPGAGFQSAWNYSFFLILIYSGSGSIVANSLSYLIGSRGAWMPSHKPLIMALSVGFFALILFVNIRGFHLGRLFTGAGGTIMIALSLLIIGLLLLRLIRREPMAEAPLTFAWPALTLASVNLFSKITFNALSGFEQVAIFAGECKTPERNIARSVWIAAPLIALIYIFGTAALLAYTPSGRIDLIAPIPQLFGAALGSSVIVNVLSATAIVALLFAVFAQAVACIAQVSRLPMVAGWDGLLPGWFSELHPRFRTPARALWCVVALCVGFGAASLIEVGEQEATQILFATAFGCCGIYYLILFAVVIRSDASWWLKLAAWSAGAVTLLSLTFQVVPILEVAHPFTFGAKVGGMMLLLNGLGAWIYLRSRNTAIQTR
jgi:amino acid transporter